LAGLSSNCFMSRSCGHPKWNRPLLFKDYIMRTIIALAALAMLASSAQAKIVKVPCFVSQGNWTNAPDKSCQIWDGVRVNSKSPPTFYPF
jgi:hypothetical protein